MGFIARFSLIAPTLAAELLMDKYPLGGVSLPTRKVSNQEGQDIAEYGVILAVILVSSVEVVQEALGSGGLWLHRQN